jgi:DNA invertase Pin-like site-specific DNA recombinase
MVNSDNTRLAYPYRRYSSSQQGDGDSIRRQKSWAEQVCASEGWTIDATFPLEDRGKSAYKGEHLKADLGRFLEAVNAGRIPRGSVLLVEELDRLDRRAKKQALPFIIGLLSSGIDIRTRDRHYNEDSIDNLGELFDIIIRQGTANEESRKKSERVGANWANWRAKLAQGVIAPPPGRTPPWVRWAGSRFVPVAAAAAAVATIFRLAGDGLGLRRILALLNAQDGPRPIGRCPSWRLSYLAKLLCSREVLGEFIDKDGIVHKGLYPAIITDEQFYRARAALEGRQIGNGGTGRNGAGVANIFAGLLYDARDGSRLHLVNKGVGGRFLLSSAALRHERGSVRVPFPYGPFEEALLSRLREIDAREVLGQGSEPDLVTVLSNEQRDVKASIKAIEAELDKDGDSPILLRRLRQKGDREKELDALIRAAQARAAHPLSASWREAGALLKALDEAPDKKDARLRLRRVLQRVVEAIRCVFVARDDARLSAVQIEFAGSDSPRHYLLWYRPSFQNKKARRRRPASCELLSSDRLTALDLRQAGHVRQVEAFLAGLDLDTS